MPIIISRRLFEGVQKMVGFVLFLLAIVLIILIFKLLPRSAYKWIGYAVLAVVGVCVIGGVWLYVQNQQNAERYRAEQQQEQRDLVTFLNDVDRWGQENAKKDSTGYYSINTQQIKQYAADLHTARKYSFYFYGVTTLGDNRVTTTLDKPLNGVSEVKIVCDGALMQSDCEKAVKNGYRGGFLLHIYTLDGGKTFSLTKGWLDPKPWDKEAKPTTN